MASPLPASRLRELLDGLPASKGLLPDEEQIERASGLVAAAWMTLRVNEREPELQRMLHEALEHLAGREVP